MGFTRFTLGPAASRGAAAIAAVLALACTSGSEPDLGTPPGPAWGGTAIMVDAGSRNTCAVATSGRIYCWGINDGGIGLVKPLTGDTYLLTCFPNGIFDRIAYQWPCVATTPVAINTGMTFASVTVTGETDPLCALTAGGTVYCFSQNADVILPSDTQRVNTGQVLCHGEPCTESPWPLSGNLTWKSFKSGRGFGCGLTMTGAAYCIGLAYAGNGSLGNGSLSFQTDVPVAVNGAHVFTTLAVGEGGGRHVCGLVPSGAAWCWGPNESRQLGNTATANLAVPTLVQGGLTFTALAAGGSFTCGLRASGQVFCWGSNGVGEAGNGVRTGTCPGYPEAYCTPTLAAGGKTFTQITAGAGHACGIDANQDAWCWGYDKFGQLGNNGVSPVVTAYGDVFMMSVVPTLVAGGLKWKSIDAGNVHTCGITTTDEVYCWGFNDTGQIGNNVDMPNGGMVVPTKVGG